MQDMAGGQAPAGTGGEGQPPSPTPTPGLPEGGSALGQMLASLVGASRVSTTPLAGLPGSVGDTSYSYSTTPQFDLSQYHPSVGGGVPPGWVDPTPGQYVQQGPTAQVGGSSGQTSAGNAPGAPVASGTPYSVPGGIPASAEEGSTFVDTTGYLWQVQNGVPVNQGLATNPNMMPGLPTIPGPWR